MRIMRLIWFAPILAIALQGCGAPFGDVNGPEAEWLRSVIAKNCEDGLFVTNKEIKPETIIIKKIYLFPMLESKMRMAEYEQNGKNRSLNYYYETGAISCSSKEWAEFINQNKLGKNPILPKTNIPVTFDPSA